MFFLQLVVNICFVSLPRPKYFVQAHCCFARRNTACEHQSHLSNIITHIAPLVNRYCVFLRKSAVYGQRPPFGGRLQKSLCMELPQNDEVFLREEERQAAVEIVTAVVAKKRFVHKGFLQRAGDESFCGYALVVAKKDLSNKDFVQSAGDESFCGCTLVVPKNDLSNKDFLHRVWATRVSAAAP